MARDIGVGEQLLGRWVAIERSRMDDPPDALDIDERAELDRLRREVTELRMDREFLKEAAAFFATENSNPSGPRHSVRQARLTYRGGVVLGAIITWLRERGDTP